MLLWADGCHDHKITPSPSKEYLKWQNLVMNLNEIICVCQERSLILKGQVYVDSFGPHSYAISYHVGLQRQFLFCPPYQRFLRKLIKVADVTIWSSMRVATANFVYDLLFKDLCKIWTFIIRVMVFKGILIIWGQGKQHRKLLQIFF